MAAEGHHCGMDCKNALFPLLNKNVLLKIDWPQPLKAAQGVLKFHGCDSAFE
jgi:hypothetical protein